MYYICNKKTIDRVKKNWFMGDEKHIESYPYWKGEKYFAVFQPMAYGCSAFFWVHRISLSNGKNYWDKVSRSDFFELFIPARDCAKST